MRIVEEIEKRLSSSALREKNLWNALKRIISDATNHLNQITSQMKYYDIHDGTHSNKVLESIEQLLGIEGIARLNLYELILLYCSCFLHDAAMAMPTWEYDILKACEGTASCYDSRLRVIIKNDFKPPQTLHELREFIIENKQDLYGDFEAARIFVFSTSSEEDLIIELAERVQDYEKYRKRFANELSDAINDVATYLELSEEIRCDYVRSTHHVRIESYVTNLRNKFSGILDPASSDRFVRYLATICRAHGETIAEVARLKHDENGFVNSERVNIRFLAIMLRLGDIIHFSNDRAPISLYSEKRIRNPESIKQWTMKFQDLSYRFNCINGKTTIFFSAYCETPETYYSLQDYIDCIDQELSCYYSFVQDMEFINFSRVKDYRLEIAQKVNRDEIFPDTKVFIPERNLKFTLEQSKILSLLMGVQLYKDKYLCLRELYQNSMDACRCMQAHNQTSEIKENSFIEFGLKEVTYSGKTRKYLYCFDNGTGMTKEIVKNFLLRIGNSYYRSREFSEQNALWRSNVNPTSQFGIGILSCFMIADKLEITTKHFNANAEIFSFVLDGPKEQFYYINTNKLDEEVIGKHGTLVKLFLTDEISRSITSKSPDKLNFYIHSKEADFFDDQNRRLELKSFHNSLFYLVNRQIGIPKADIQVSIRLENNTTKLLIPWNTVFDFRKFDDITPEDMKVLLKRFHFFDGSENPYEKTIENRDLIEDYLIEVKSENINLYTLLSLPLNGMPCDITNAFNLNLFVWNANDSVLVDGVKVDGNGSSELSSAITHSIKYNSIIDFSGKNRPALSVDRNSIISISDDLISECQRLANSLAYELAKCVNDHISQHSLAPDSIEAITSLEVVIRKFPNIADQIVLALSQMEAGIMPIKELAIISKLNSIKEILESKVLSLNKINMSNLHEISREIILGKAQNASRISVTDDNITIATNGYTSIVAPESYYEHNGPLSLSTLVIRADEWGGKYTEYDLVSSLWPIVPSRLFDNVCSKDGTEIIVENRSRKTPSYSNSLSGIAQLDPALINPKFGESSKERDYYRSTKNKCYVGTCEKIQNVYWLPEFYDYSDQAADNKNYVLFAYIAPRKLNEIEKIKLKDYENSDPIYVQGLHKGWSILFIGHAKQYVFLPSIVSRSEILKSVPKSLLNHELEDITYYNLDGTIAF